METITEMDERPTAVPAGSAVDFAVVAMEMADGLVRLALLLSGGHADAQDVVAEATARVYLQWQRGKVAEPRAYLRTAVVNEVRRRGRRVTLERRSTARAAAGAPGTERFDGEVADRDVLLAALARLPLRQRTAVVLRHVADLSVADTAAAMRTTEGTVKSQVARGLAAMRAHLDERGDPR